MSHAASIMAHFNNQPNMRLDEIVTDQAFYLMNLAFESLPYFDSSDPACMPHYFTARVRRWSENTLNLANRANDPVAAIEITCESLIRNTAYAYQALTADDKTMFDDAMSYQSCFRKPAPINLPIAAREAVEAQRLRTSQMRDESIRLMIILGNQYPRETIATFDKYQNLIDQLMSTPNVFLGTLDLVAFRSHLAKLCATTPGPTNFSTPARGV